LNQDVVAQQAELLGSFEEIHFVEEVGSLWLKKERN
jgi:hypothetical protein